ncbi:MAG TPA: FHA domain-containing protein [Thermoanaerobaculia bacterium]|nr:FHA domain-containing protein [Thermoanaerobaculia bacterium]
MIVECDQCHAKFQYDESRFGDKAAKKLRCSRCRAIFEVVNTHAFEAGPAVRPNLPPDETRSRHSARPRREPPRPSAEKLALPPDVKLSLAVIAGPDAGRMFLIEKPRTVIGREDVDLALDDPEISRQHAAVEVAGERVTVIDLGSANGIQVGDQSVAEAPLENQAEFTVGGSTLMLIVTPVH